MNIDQDIIETRWAMETFQRCVPDRYKTSVDILTGRHFSNHPSEEAIKKVVLLLQNCDKYKYDTVEKQVNFIKSEIK